MDVEAEESDDDDDDGNDSRRVTELPECGVMLMMRGTTRAHVDDDGPVGYSASCARIVADAATQARRCNHGPRATPAHCGSGRSAYQSPVDVGKHEGKHEGTAATLRPAREGGAACQDRKSVV